MIGRSRTPMEHPDIPAFYTRRTITMPATSRLTSWREVKNRQPLLSVNDGSRNHGTVQCNPTQARQIDIPVMLPDSEP